MVLPRFLTELKRRNVYRAALVYAGVGWVLLEFADVAFPRLGLPNWTVNFVLALFGFPFVIVFAWIFDLNTQGIVRTEPISPESQHRFSITSIVEFTVICVLVVTVGYLYVERLSLQKMLVTPESSVQDKPVVPNPEQYRAIAEIADILGVQAVLEGSVRRSGDRVRVSAQLIDASNGFHIWSRSYERQLNDIFQLQDEMAGAVVKVLRIELGVNATTTSAARWVAFQCRSGVGPG